MRQFYNKHGIEIIKNNDRFFMRYDSGEVVAQMRELEITKEEARQIQSSGNSNELYDCLVKILNRRSL